MMCEKSIEQRALNHKAKQQKEQRERGRERDGEGAKQGTVEGANSDKGVCLSRLTKNERNCKMRASKARNWANAFPRGEKIL